MNWYALYTAGGTEEKVKSILERQLEDFSFVIYRRRLRERKDGKWHMIDRKMFPGYILMGGDITDQAWHELKACDADFKLLENNGEYLTLSDQEVKTLSLLDGDANGLVDMSRLYIDGDRVHVIEGPLKGQEARITEVNKRKGRAKVKIDFCGSERIIELGVELIEKISETI
jgi:transcriptional antiterminator NusG